MSKLRTFEDVLTVDNVLLLFFMYIELIGYMIVEKFLVLYTF